MSNTKTNKAKILVNYLPFYGKTYSIQKPSDWLIQMKNEHFVVFEGPKIGNFPTHFFIKTINNYPKDYLHAAEESKLLRQKQGRLRILEERDMSQESFSAIARHSAWYDYKKDIMMFARDAFVAEGSTVHVLSSLVPNNPHLKEFDNIFVTMLNSFRYASAQI